MLRGQHSFELCKNSKNEKILQPRDELEFFFVLHLFFDPISAGTGSTPFQPHIQVNQWSLSGWWIIVRHWSPARYCRWHGVLTGPEQRFKSDPGAITHSKPIILPQPSAVYSTSSETQREVIVKLSGPGEMDYWSLYVFCYGRFRERKRKPTCGEWFNQRVPRSILFKEMFHCQTIFLLLFFTVACY